MATNFKITFDLGSVLDIRSMVNKEVFPLLNQAVRAVAQKTASDWQQSVYQAKLWSGEKDKYAQSITWTMTGDFSAEVEATYRYAEEIEKGRPPRDLKRMLDTSLKVRTTEKGKRFLVIPFRHNTPGNDAHAPAMSNAVHDMVKDMASSTITGQSQRPSGEVTTLSPKSGMAPAAKQTPFLSNPKTKNASQVNRNAYAWGDRLTAAALKSAGVMPIEAKYREGMRRFDTSTPGGAKSSQYLTFRIMMEGSTGWIVAAQPGQNIARGVQEAMQPKAQAAFAEAIKRTLAPK